MSQEKKEKTYQEMVDHWVALGYTTAAAERHATDQIKLIARLDAEKIVREELESVDNLKEIEYNSKSDEPKTKGGFATLCVLGAAALAVAVPYLVNKFKKED